MYSVRQRLTIVLAAGFILLIAGLGFHVAGIVRARVTEEFDAVLLAKARALAALTEQEDGQIELDYVPEHMPEFERADAPEYFQFWLHDGLMLMRSRHLTADFERVGAPVGRPGIRDVALPDGRPGRLVEYAFVPRDAGGEPASNGAEESEAIGPAGDELGLVLVVARGRERLDGLIAGLRGTMLVAGGLAVLLGLLFVWRVLAHGFRPIGAVAAQVGALDAESLEARVTLPTAPREVAPIVDQLNSLLRRLDDSFARERRFTGNVAHELRTPLAELRSLADVGRRWPDDEEAVARYFEDVRDISSRMEGVIADLLLLARCHAGVERVQRAPTRLSQIVRSTWSKVAAHAGADVARLQLDLPEDLVVESDPGKLEILLSNLLGNAVSHGSPEGQIRCSGARVGPTFRFEVTNAAALLSADELAQMAEPFWRKDAARADADHAGLGLALVTALSALLGLDVAFGQDPDGTFRVRLEGRPAGQAVLQPR